MPRVRFVQISQKEFFTRVFHNAKIDHKTIAAICGIKNRTLYDWARGKYLIPFSAYKKLCALSKLKMPDIEILQDYWHAKNAGQKGARVRYTRYGNQGTA